jgi:hypothetical protein
VLTVDADTVEHVLKTNFTKYEKGPTFKTLFYDFLGDGIFNADGTTWKKQR